MKLTRKTFNAILQQPQFGLMETWLKQGLNLPHPIHGHYFNATISKMGDFAFHTPEDAKLLQIGMRIVLSDSKVYCPQLWLLPQFAHAETEDEWEDIGLLTITIDEQMELEVVLCPKASLALEIAQRGIIPLSDPITQEMNSLVNAMNQAGHIFMTYYIQEEDTSGRGLLGQLGIPLARAES